MNPIVHVLRGTDPEKHAATTPLTLVPTKASPDIIVEENDVGKIGFTLDVSMRLVAERLADQDFGTPVSSIERTTPPDLADSA